ncbi:MAG: DUF3048 domain-containing protein [Parcubacteria group bacterium]|jgi:hypothetical protein
MEKKQKIIIVVAAIILIGAGGYFFFGKKNTAVKQIDLSKDGQSQDYPIANDGPVSPITGLACENWNKRPVAVMQPADVQARPAAGFSEADMVIEMPAFTGSVTRLMGIYGCNVPKEVGAIRSSRHDYMALAAGLNAIYIHWGGSHFALDLLSQHTIDNYDCMTGSYCERWPVSGIMRLEDTGHITSGNIAAMIAEKKYSTENKFSGYAHQGEAPLADRPAGGNLRVAFKKPYDVEYNYDKETNSYLRVWGEANDTDRNNKQRVAPKNVVVMFAQSEQITTEQDYLGKNLQDPWKNVEDIKKTGSESITGRYNNMQIGDPWYDSIDTGEAHYYMNGKESIGTWKKDKNRIDSKLMFYDQSGQEVKFVPGQIWLDILEPGQALRWTPVQ